MGSVLGGSRPNTLSPQKSALFLYIYIYIYMGNVHMHIFLTIRWGTLPFLDIFKYKINVLFKYIGLGTLPCFHVQKEKCPSSYGERKMHMNIPLYIYIYMVQSFIVRTLQEFFWLGSFSIWVRHSLIFDCLFLEFSPTAKTEGKKKKKKTLQEF